MERPERLDLQSADGAQLNLDALYQIAPSCFTEATDPKTGKIKRVVNFDVLRQLLGDDTVEDATEAYEFNWVGKQEARAEVLRPINKTLRPVKEDSVDWDNTQNLYIEGDNLEVLKLLQKSYLGKVKMIYIDPPYNTGNDFLYNDNTTDSLEDFEVAEGNVDELGNRFRKNLDSDGRFHSKWCGNIYSRLMIARSLLTEDGAIFISIDDTELHNLIKMCNEVFGESNYLNTISVKAKSSAGASGGGEDKKLKKNIEYILVYVKSPNFTAFNVAYNVTPLEDYIKERKDAGKNFAYTSVLTNSGTEEYLTTIKDGKGEDIQLYKVSGYEIKSVSELSKSLGVPQIEVYNRYINQVFTLENAQTSIRDRVLKGAGDGDDYIIAKYKPVSGRNKGVLTSVGFMGKTKRLVSYLGVLCEVRDDKVYKKDKVGTLWDDLSWSSLHTEACIPYPNAQKPLGLLQRLIEMQTDKDSIILDFYAGSCTTAHATMIKNSLDNGHRRFIVVQIQEHIDPSKYSNPKTKEQAEKSIEYLDTVNKPHNICELGKERIRIAGKKIKDEHPEAKDLDAGFRVFRIDESNFEDVERTPKEYNQDQLDLFLNNVKSDRDDLDLLFGCMLDWGVKLSLPMSSEEVDGKMIYTVNDGDLVACFADKVTDKVVKAMADKQPLRVIFRDSCFEQDADKINIYETFKQLLDWSDENVKNNIRVI